MPHKDLLRHLDPDVLLTLFTALHQEGALLELSATCKWIRESCSPVLFGSCGIASYEYNGSTECAFPPRSLWPYIRTLRFRGTFSHRNIPYPETDGSAPFEAEFAYESLCRLAARDLGRCIKDMLCSMPYLHTVTFALGADRYASDPRRLPGASWYILDAVLSTPQLRTLRVYGQICSPTDELPLDVMTPAPSSSLTTVEYRLIDHNLQPRANSLERELRFLFARVSPSIEQLDLPNEPVPLADMCQMDWPNLRKLTFEGERQARDTDDPLLVSTLGRMPRLRSLTLQIAEQVGVKFRPVWPPSFSASYEWQDLEQLTVTHPHPKDELFAHLPRSLGRLVLRCWPRHYQGPSTYKQLIPVAYLEWLSPLLTSSEMLRMLRKSDTPNLTHLELEFRGSDTDEPLFNHIVSSYPRLKVLSVHRYRPDSEAEVPVSTVMQAVSRLRDLRLLRLHLDYPFLPPGSLLCGGARRGWTTAEAEHIDQVMNDAEVALKAVADAFAQASPPFLEYISLLLPPRRWMTFRVIRSGEADGTGVAEECPSSSIGDTIYGLPTVTDS